jgi:hypothetical protein
VALRLRSAVDQDGRCSSLIARSRGPSGEGQRVGDFPLPRRCVYSQPRRQQAGRSTTTGGLRKTLSTPPSASVVAGVISARLLERLIVLPPGNRGGGSFSSELRSSRYRYRTSPTCCDTGLREEFRSSLSDSVRRWHGARGLDLRRATV